MARTRTSEIFDPATGKPMPEGIAYRGPSQYRARKLVDGRQKQNAAVRIDQAAVERRRGPFLADTWQGEVPIPVIDDSHRNPSWITVITAIASHLYRPMSGQSFQCGGPWMTSPGRAGVFTI
jgi:hypothetical protein